MSEIHNKIKFIFIDIYTEVQQIFDVIKTNFDTFCQKMIDLETFVENIVEIPHNDHLHP